MRKQALMLTKSSFVTAAPPQLLVRARWHLGQGRHSADLEEKALRTSGASNNQFAEVVTGFEHLRAAGKIRAWGVSNFSVRKMEDLFRVSGGDRCATNQVPYSLSDRRIERDLPPWCKQAIARSLADLERESAIQ